jgi:hypothetical protein
MTPFRYCLTLGAAAAALAGAIASFNYAVDPYLLFDVKRVHGFNDLKPSVATRERMMKAYQAGRVSARTIVIGSSRPDLGIDPATNSWPASARPVYNLSLVGSGTTEGMKYLRHYLAMNPGHAPRTVVVGLDFESFLYVPSRGPNRRVKSGNTSELEERLAVDAGGNPNPQRTARVLKDRALGLLSLDAIVDSIKTITGSRSASVTNLEPNGHLSEAGFRDTAHADGFQLLFTQKHLDAIKQYGKPRRVLSDTPDSPIREFGALRELLLLAKANGIEVILVIQPAHASRLELLDRMGYWGDYERWKRELVVLSAQAGAGQKVALWDFGGYEREAREPVPAKGKGIRDMQWFWDPVHYTSKLGDVMVARIFTDGQGEGFGVQLTPANVDAQIARVRRDREAFRAAMPEETARLSRLVCGTWPCPAPSDIVASAR